MMWFPETVSARAHWLMPIVVFIHSAVALVTIAAFIIHTGHYFHLRLTSWIFGSGTFFHKDEKRA